MKEKNMMEMGKIDRIMARKQSSRAPFRFRRDTVKLNNAHFVSDENKVAGPLWVSQITSLKFEEVVKENTKLVEKRKMNAIFCLDNGVHYRENSPLCVIASLRLSVDFF